VSVEIAEHEAAAVEEEQQRSRRPALARIVEPEADLAAGAGAGEVADDRQLAGRKIGDVARLEEHRPRFLEPGLVSPRTRQGVQEVEKAPDIGAYEGLWQRRLQWRSGIGAPT
jgi:hypothetical protein